MRKRQYLTDQLTEICHERKVSNGFLGEARGFTAVCNYETLSTLIGRGRNRPRGEAVDSRLKRLNHLTERAWR